MSIGVGVIGAGVMGSDHARLIRSHVSGAHLVAVADADPARAREAAAGARVDTDPLELIDSPDIQAVIIASPDHTHGDFVLAAIRAGKPVLCEKPLAATSEDCLRIIDAERMAGLKLVHTGYMRRYDPTYRELKATLQARTLGEVRILHNQHRNRSAPDWFTADMAVTNSFVHEIDVSRWLLGTEFKAVTVVACGSDRPGVAADPLLITLEAENGALVSTEVFLNAGYGYHVHAEAVCERGGVRMGQPALTSVLFEGSDRAAFPANWIPRFADAYRLQDQAWVNAIHSGTLDADASSSWDGYLASYIAERTLEALKSGRRIELQTPRRSDKER
jgi:myo-inositol 2-dehydrogenase / D-chiro-inositol 1-dehydrogenase